LKVWQVQNDGTKSNANGAVETTIHQLNKIAADGYLSMAQFAATADAPKTYTEEFQDYTSTGYINGRTGGLQADNGMWRAPDGRVPDIEQVYHTDPYAEYRHTGLDRYMDISTLHESMQARANRKQPKLSRKQIEKLQTRKKEIKKRIQKTKEEQEDRDWIV